MNPDLELVRTKQDFARELTLLRQRADLTVREVAKLSGILPSTVGGYFSGRYLPNRQQYLVSVLKACGVDGDQVARWCTLLLVVSRSPGRRPADAPVPYRGLESFQPEHAAWFYGREELTRSLVDVVAERGPHGPVIVVGPSGSGKSSLLRAGLVPAMCGDEPPVAGPWHPVLLSPGNHPVEELAGRLAARSREGNALVVVDQFEELFTLCGSRRERKAFVVELITASQRDDTLVVLGMRADFYSQASRLRELVPALQQAQVVVGPMNTDELRRAIVEPARRAKFDFDDGLVELLLRELSPGGLSEDAHDDGVLPLLSFALHATWERSRRGRLTTADYQATGGIGGAITRSAETAYDELDESRKPIARDLFLRMVHLGEKTADTRRRVPFAEVLSDDDGDDDASEVLDTFVNQRLITADAGSVNITHEALLTAWPRLREWIDADREGLRVHRQLTHDAEAWRDAGRDAGGLYRGFRLVAAQEWAAAPAHNDALNSLEREFLAASVELRDVEERARRRRTRVLRSLVVILAALVLVAGTLTGYVFQQRGIALKDRDDAMSRQLAGEANRLRDHDVTLAMQLSLAAYQISPTAEARASLLDSTANTTATRILGPEGAMQSIAFTRDGRVMAAGGADKTVRLWRLGEPRAVPLAAPLTGASDTIYSVAFSPDAKLLAQGGGDRVVRLWDVADPANPKQLGTPLTGPVNTIYSVAFSPDGATLAAGSADNAIHLWDIRDPSHPVALTPLAGFSDYVQSVVFSPDGRTLVAGGADGTIRMWEVTGQHRFSPLGRPIVASSRKVFTVAVSPDGRTLAAGSADKNIYLWDITDRATPKPSDGPLTGSASWINGIAFSPDGTTLAAGSSDNVVRLWHLASRTRRDLPHPGPVTAVAYMADGKTLGTGAADGVARLWAVPGPVITDSADAIFNVMFGPTGTMLATGSGMADGAFRLWEISDRLRPRLVGSPHQNPLVSNKFSGSSSLSPDGRTFAAGGANGEVQLWDVADPERVVPLGTPLTGPTTLSQYVQFSTDSKMLAAAGEDKVIHLWDVSDRARPRPLPTLSGPTNHVYAVAFSPDDTKVAAGSLDNSVWLWDITDPQEPRALATLTGFAHYAYSVVFSPDGRTLAASSADKTIRLWDISDPERPRALGEPLTGPTNYVYTVAFSPDGRTLAASSADKTVRLWDVSTVSSPRHLATLLAATGSVHTVVFSPDGRTIAGGTADRTARLWLVDPAQAGELVCRLSGDQITAAEWNRYVPGIPYRQSCTSP